MSPRPYIERIRGLWLDECPPSHPGLRVQIAESADCLQESAPQGAHTFLEHGRIGLHPGLLVVLVRNDIDLLEVAAHRGSWWRRYSLVGE